MSGSQQTGHTMSLMCLSLTAMVKCCWKQSQHTEHWHDVRDCIWERWEGRKETKSMWDQAWNHSSRTVVNNANALYQHLQLLTVHLQYTLFCMDNYYSMTRNTLAERCGVNWKKGKKVKTATKRGEASQINMSFLVCYTAVFGLEIFMVILYLWLPSSHTLFILLQGY